MRPERLFLIGTATLLMVPASGYSVGTTFSIKLVAPKIDYPATGVIGTRAQDINNLGNVVVFDLNTSAGAEVGYHPAIGNFITPESDPNAPVFTQPDQMNNSNIIVGDYLDASNVIHGFTLNSGVFTTFDVSAAGVH
jgi:hypothetical protein